MLARPRMNAKPPRRAPRSLRPALLTALTALSACASTYRDWQDLGVRPQAFQDIWDAVAEVSTRHGMAPHGRYTDRGRGQFTSRWREVTPGFGQSMRQRVRAQLIEQKGEDDAVLWQVRLCVERERVKDLGRSLQPREEDWSSDGQDQELEQIIVTQLRLRFGDPLPGSTGPGFEGAGFEGAGSEGSEAENSGSRGPGSLGSRRR